ncbi:MAG: hypothetical protein EHM18_00770 [Acidobacteria bacterium]|nr:MAG: hypothetical protein EHM18_00770 [Acidobacteriota bacterium]
MKILVIGLESADPSVLVENERMINVRHLMTIGCFGSLEPADSDEHLSGWDCMAASRAPGLAPTPRTPIWDHLAAGGRRSVLFGLPQPADAPAEDNGLIRRYSSCRDSDNRLLFELSRDASWDYLQWVEEGADYRDPDPEYWARLDRTIGELLESITDETVVLVVAIPCPSGSDSPRGCFVLAAANNPLNGPVEGARLIDMAPTLLELSGFPPLPGAQGVSLASPVSQSVGETDDEEIMRDRLRGLGYIA